ncbi:hypothetical protein HYV80_03250 [Candidatus Woesearchaeota archaeon]|nr:hypothetical protein [Candidatus Woesearchaeota archaeon]
MATITVSIKDEVNNEFREAVRKKLGHGKGTIGKAVEEALQKWMYDDEQRKIAQEAKEMMNKGLYSLKGWKFNRDEIYDRNL